MAEGKGIAMAGAALVCLLVLQYAAVARAAVYTVGDDQGWTFNVSFWPLGKTFHAGDILEFKYNPRAENVVAVDKVGYSWCMILPKEATVYKTGKDEIKLEEGQNYFISSLPFHCQMGVKLAITAT